MDIKLDVLMIWRKFTFKRIKARNVMSSLLKTTLLNSVNLKIIIELLAYKNKLLS